MGSLIASFVVLPRGGPCLSLRGFLIETSTLRMHVPRYIFCGAQAFALNDPNRSSSAEKRAG
eukprot:scaffold315495_cov33-Prasinocladus_malaysianus.AAC.1